MTCIQFGAAVSKYEIYSSASIWGKTVSEHGSVGAGRSAVVPALGAGRRGTRRLRESTLLEVRSPGGLHLGTYITWGPTLGQPISGLRSDSAALEKTIEDSYNSGCLGNQRVIGAGE